jgi:3-methyladenine DNA glycosylase AlkD
MNNQILEEIKAACVANVTLTQEAARRFFKTAAGSYSAHDHFLGLTVPRVREIAKKYQHIELKIVKELLKSPYNEERLLALLILTHHYQKGSTAYQGEVCQFYLENLTYVNNWNLVDSSAHHILGHYVSDKDRSPLNKLAQSDILWERRISIVATWYFIRKDDTSTTFDVAKLLLQDTHDLIHKAVGWMLREAGKKDARGLIRFLSTHAKHMPRTMLRYAMERLEQEQKMALSRFSSSSSIQ